MNNFSYSTRELADMVEPVQVNVLYHPSKSIKRIGLTGASGFLGLHLVADFIKDPNIEKIKCFIRSKATFDARKKLFNLDFSEDKLEFYFEFNTQNTKDLDLFIHSAAQVHNIKKLSGLYADNVTLTMQVIEKVACPIAYISTLSVYASSNIQGTHLPQPCDISDNHLLYGGYAQSKWLGEYLVQQRPDSKIFRLGLLTPSSISPMLQENEFFSLFLKLSKDFPYYPEGFEESFIDVSPIDLSSKEISESLALDAKYIHIANKNPTSIKEFIGALNLKPIAIEKWLAHLDGLKRTEKILLSYAYFKTQSLAQYPGYFNIDLFQTTGHNWGGEITIENMNRYIRKIYEKV